MNTKHLFPAGMLIGAMILMIINVAFEKTNKQNVVKEYLQHPERYAIQYVYPKGDTVCVDTIVTYLK